MPPPAVHPLNLIRPCTQGDGIVALSRRRKLHLAQTFQAQLERRNCVVFVAASGAATRFSQLPRECDAAHPGTGALSARLQRLPCFDGIRSRGCLTLAEWRRNYGELLAQSVRLMTGTDSESIAKALVPFHKYGAESRTPLEEHAREAALYAGANHAPARLHFTISAEHFTAARNYLDKLLSRLDTQGIQCFAGLSPQQDDADSILYDATLHPVRDAHGNVIRRPSGHGALLSNLNALRGDIVFIRTVDNVLPDRLKPRVVFYKRVLGGLLLELEGLIHNHLRALNGHSYGQHSLENIQQFAAQRLSVSFPEDFAQLPRATRVQLLIDVLNRPLRVCGVIRHHGEPGGAPFWTREASGRPAIRIVEPAEVDAASPGQDAIWNSAQYFNPVDIVCSLRDYLGQPFNLENYADHDAWFMVRRMHQGVEVRLRERPGLWNGGMAYWNTVFVEVPSATAAPVKSLLDLLKPAHRT